MPQWLYLDAAGDVTGQCHVQDNQWLPWDGTVREEVAPSVGPHSPLHINPVPDRVHSFRTQGENLKIKLLLSLIYYHYNYYHCCYYNCYCYYYFIKIEVSCPTSSVLFPLMSETKLSNQKTRIRL